MQIFIRTLSNFVFCIELHFSETVAGGGRVVLNQKIYGVVRLISLHGR